MYLLSRATERKRYPNQAVYHGACGVVLSAPTDNPFILFCQVCQGRFSGGNFYLSISVQLRLKFSPCFLKRVLTNQNRHDKLSKIIFVVERRGLIMPNDLMTVSQTAKYLQLSDKTVRRLIKDGRLPVSKVSDRSLRIRTSDVDAYVQANLNGKKENNNE
jgi:excisionase family DNA binding protein